MKTKGLVSLVALATLGFTAAQGFTAHSASAGYGFAVSPQRARALYADALRRSPGACRKAATSQSGDLIKALPRGNNEFVVCDFTNESFATDFYGNRGIWRNNRFERFR
jgi:hypothetical protein